MFHAPATCLLSFANPGTTIQPLVDLALFAICEWRISMPLEPQDLVVALKLVDLADGCRLAVDKSNESRNLQRV